MIAHPAQGSPAATPALARHGIDRAGAERTHDGLVEAARRDPATRVLVVRGDAAPLATTDAAAPALHLVAPADVRADAEWGFLGRDESGHAVLVAAVASAAEDAVDAPGGWGALRVVGGGLDDVSAGLFVEALSLGRWLREAPFCPACGAKAELENAGWSRKCTGCGREHFPRTDPAVIVAVQSVDGERLLLGSNALWDQNRYSCFAGFVEAGESLEACVEREVAEECGVRVVDAQYRGSQAWPYPRSLMLGFWARAVDDADAEADGEEIVQVRWFTRDEIGAAFAGVSDVTLPGTSSIAYTLIRDWYEGA